jgi:hypothetical protein
LSYPFQPEKLLSRWIWAIKLPSRLYLLRKAIAEELSKYDEILKGEIELDESYFGGKRKGKRGRGAAGKTIVSGILERGGKVSVEIVKNVAGEISWKRLWKRWGEAA